MAGFSNTVEDQVQNLVFRNTGGPAYSAWWLSIHDGDPGETGANEISGGSYARQSLTFNASSGGLVDNVAQEDFVDMPAVTITHIGVWSAATAGTFIAGGALDLTKVIGSGDTVRLAAGDLDITLD